MNISFVLAVHNKIDLTKQCYKHLRDVYPTAPLVITSGGSTDGTEEWLKSLKDENLIYTHTENKTSFSENYNNGIKLVKTDKLVLIHNDMIIGKSFLENLDELLKENMVLTYTTVEPPIFAGHRRPGKVILDLGRNFDDFNYKLFEQYVEENKNKKELYSGAVFFMSGYKKMFEDVGYFDGVTFNPAFCEDDDFLVRAKLKGYDLKTTESAIVFHFVSQTSRFSDEFKNTRNECEMASKRNFVRKWGLPIYTFHDLKYWEVSTLNYTKFTMGMKTNKTNIIQDLELFFDKIDLGTIPEEYIKSEQKHTNYDLRSKFGEINGVDVELNEIDDTKPMDFETLCLLRLTIPQYEVGEYELNNFKIEIKKTLN